MQPQTVPIAAVQAIVQTARENGIDDQALDAWLHTAGISPDLLAQGRSRVTADQAGRLVKQLSRISGDELFGLGPYPVPLGTFRLIATALITAGDLREVLRRWSGFGQALPGMPRIDTEIGPDRVRIRLDFTNWTETPAVAIDFILMSMHRYLSWMIGRRLPLLAVELSHPAPAGFSHDEIFGRPAEYDTSDAAISFAAELLDASIVRDERELAKFLAETPVNVIVRRDFGTSETDRVRAVLARGLQGGDWPTPEEIAVRLTTSVSTLRRKLADEGTSFSIIKEELRRDAAITSLVRGEESVADLSVRLGFAEPSTFHRAFRRWTGSAPGAYRAAQHGTDPSP
ncbi:AraC family transcriptional regulator [Nocardia yamanashiensis]|uniref:AraC family transcriptional regulator n=1 Tax=Nocardia yamanashiensis TaxID=209247 RepID=UPI001E33F156|nr:AraC family transcriptional regulator [Nocardia yamanashiensis]UGT38849.1 AraC family transcriptional regulator [Nocardia yamanashiensis]